MIQASDSMTSNIRLDPSNTDVILVEPKVALSVMDLSASLPAGSVMFKAIKGEGDDLTVSID